MKPKKLSRNTTKRNEARVLLARDVLAQLTAGEIKAGYGYLSWITRGRTGVVYDTPDGTLVNEIVANKVCQVCARGAIFVAAVKRDGPITIGTLGGDQAAGMTNFLKPWFTSAALNTIENFYELNHNLANSATAYFMRDRRMRIIMETIVNSHGRVSGRILLAAFESAAAKAGLAKEHTSSSRSVSVGL